MKSKAKLFDILNPKNLQKKIDGYGYSFSIGKYALSIMATIILAIAFGAVFSLKWKYMVTLAIVFIICLPGMILRGYKNMYEHKRFLDITDYMEQILYSFKVNGKILSSLRDTQTLFTGNMNRSIQKAINNIENKKGKGNIYQEALKKIEEDYPNEHLHAIHEYLVVVENNGGNSDISVDLLLGNKNIWADNILLLQEEKKSSRNKVIMSLVVTMVMSVVFHGLYRSTQLEIVSNPIIQVVTTLYIILNMLILCRANKEISKSWIERETSKKSKKAVQYLELVNKYNLKKERKKSIFMASPFFIAVIPLVFYAKTYIALAMFGIGIFILNQHKIGYRLAYERVVREINMTFPRWLMEFALLMQGNNVNNSILKSTETAPEILRPELKELVNEINKNPNSQEPYINFLKDFQLSSVQSSMKMIYAISKGSGEVDTQIKMLIERNSKLLDKAEKIENENSLAGITGLFYLPQITVSLQLLVTMAVFALSFFSNTIIS